MRCQFSEVVSGSIAGHNIPGVSLKGVTLQVCQEACAREPKCKSIDYKADGGECYLGDCQVGDGECVNDDDSDYQYSACEVPDKQMSTVRAKCNTLACPDGLALKPGAEKFECSDSKCSVQADLALCCYGVCLCVCVCVCGPSHLLAGGIR